MTQISDQHEIPLGEWSIKVIAFKDGKVMVCPLFKGKPPTEPGMMDVQIDGSKGSAWERETEAAVEKLSRRIRLMSRMEGQKDMSLAFLRHGSMDEVPPTEEELEKEENGQDT